MHIPQRFAGPINAFYTAHLNVYLNYHRPCGFATIRVNAKGKERKVYDTYQTPHERFRSLDDAKKFLREGLTIEQMESRAIKKSDNECAVAMQKAKKELFANIRHQLNDPLALPNVSTEKECEKIRPAWKPAQDHPWRKRFFVQERRQMTHESSQGANVAHRAL
jgi:hypothetical protein